MVPRTTLRLPPDFLWEGVEQAVILVSFGSCRMLVKLEGASSYVHVPNPIGSFITVSGPELPKFGYLSASLGDTWVELGILKT